MEAATKFCTLGSAGAPVGAALLGRGAGAELVEDVVGALGRVDGHHAAALQQVRADARAADAPRHVKVDLHKLAEARGVVVAHGLRVAERLQQRVGLQHLRNRA